MEPKYTKSQLNAVLEVLCKIKIDIDLSFHNGDCNGTVVPLIGMLRTSNCLDIAADIVKEMLEKGYFFQGY